MECALVVRRVRFLLLQVELMFEEEKKPVSEFNEKWSYVAPELYASTT
jgi:hypothetical protein